MVFWQLMRVRAQFCTLKVRARMKSTRNARLVPCLYSQEYRQALGAPFKGFHWIRCAEDLTSRFVARASYGTNRGHS